ncbi:MAG: response regulator [Pyrinomonadaceae bacterium]
MSDSRKKLNQAGARRVLIITDTAKAAFQTQLTAAGYETLATTSGRAIAAIADFAPDLVMMEVHTDDAARESVQVSLARQLRARAATYALPIIFVFDEDGSALRQTSSNIGVDDYFSLTTPYLEMLARLDALFWRVEAGRRAATVTGDQRLEIDNFLLLLDTIREHIGAGREGSLAIIHTSSHARQPSSSKKSAGDNYLKMVIGFFKLQLRRLDAVAFYGPDALIAYMPGMNTQAAAHTLSSLRGQFARESSDSDVTIGLASFPADAADLEKLLERCEVAARRATSQSGYQVMTFSETGPQEASAEILRTAEMATNPSSSSLPSEHLELLVSEFEAAKASTAPVIGSIDGSAPEPSALTHSLETGGRHQPSDSSVPRRVLLAVSDAGRMAKLNSLLRSAGYEVRAAFDGEQALNLLRIERPHLLILESDLDKISGLEMMRRLRKQAGGKIAAPVIFLVPYTDDTAGQEARALGARDVVSVPYDPAELMAKTRLAVNIE